MSCSITNKKDKATALAIDAFKGKSKSFRVIKPGVIEMPVSSKFTKNQLYNIALKNSNRVTTAMLNTYGPKFGYGWVSIDTTLTDVIVARIHVPNELVQAWHVQLGLKSLEEINSDSNLFTRDLSFFRGDEQLMEQEYKNDEDFYKDNDEKFSNFDMMSKYKWRGTEGEYDGSANWRHDFSKDKNIQITDAELAAIKRNRNIC